MRLGQEIEERRMYRQEYYKKNKDKIQQYQREYYKKFLKPKHKKQRKPNWKGAKTEGGLVKREGVFILKFD